MPSSILLSANISTLFSFFLLLVPYCCSVRVSAGGWSIANSHRKPQSTRNNVGLRAPTQAILTDRALLCNVPNKHKKLLDRIRLWDAAEAETPKIFCGIYTQKQSEKKQLAILETWGLACDKIIFFSDKKPEVSKLRARTIEIEPEHGPDVYDNMYHKVRAIWRFVLGTYGWEYEYFYICGDDTYVIVDNLR
jgi:hypothetical protein